MYLRHSVQIASLNGLYVSGGLSKYKYCIIVSSELVMRPIKGALDTWTLPLDM